MKFSKYVNVDSNLKLFPNSDVIPELILSQKSDSNSDDENEVKELSQNSCISHILMVSPAADKFKNLELNQNDKELHIKIMEIIISLKTNAKNLIIIKRVSYFISANLK